MFVAAIAMLAGQAIPAVMTETGPKADRKLICHRELTTGTLVGYRNICHTKAEWQQITDNAVATSQALVDRGLIQPTNGSLGGGG